jgi:hypothetical protein
MTQTPNSSAVSYLSAADMLNRADARLVGDLVSMNGVRVQLPALLTNPVLLAALADASGEVEAAVLRGNRYQPADLLALTGVGQTRLYRLVKDLAMLLLFHLRDDVGPVPPKYTSALEELEKLACGERIFSFVESQNAGLMQHAKETWSDRRARNLLSYQARRFFGPRGHG